MGHNSEIVFVVFLNMIFPISIWSKGGILDFNGKKSQLSFSVNLKNGVVSPWEGSAEPFFPFTYCKYPSVQRRMSFGKQPSGSWRTHSEGLILPTTRVIDMGGGGKLSHSWGLLLMSLCCLGEKCVHSQVGVVLEGDRVRIHLTHSWEWRSFLHSLCPQDV